MDGAENSGRGIPRDILNAEAASPPFGQFPAVPVKTMISVSNVSMRYGAKVLFDEVSTGFTPGKRYGLTGPNGAGKSTFMNLLTGELEPQKGTVVRPKKLGVLSQDQFASTSIACSIPSSWATSASGRRWESATGFTQNR